MRAIPSPQDAGAPHRSGYCHGLLKFMSKRPIKHLRWYIAALLCLASELNYLDRQVLSVLAETIQRELKLTTVDYSYITSSFLASYTIMYAISGRLVDRLGSRRGFAIFVTGWSAANMLHALARTAMQLSFFRFLLGATEAANFPAGMKAISEWFPMRERALAVGLFNAGSAAGAALAAPVASYIALAYGWQYAFVVTGALGLVWVVLWWAFYRLPQDHPRLSEAERELILSDAGEKEAPVAQVPLRVLLKMRETWGCVLVRFLTDPVTYFLTFWMPKYLQQERGFSLAEVGKYAWIPYVALALGGISGGAIARLLVSRGWSVNRARKTTMLVISCLIPVCYLLVTRVESPALAVALMAALMFGHNAWGNIAIATEVFPKRVVGTVTGLGGTIGGVAGIISQLGIGWVVQHFSFAPVFTACGVVYLIAFGVVQWLIGELGVVRRVEAAAEGV